MSDLILLISETRNGQWHWALGEQVGRAKTDAEKYALNEMTFSRLVVVIPGMDVITKLHTLTALSTKQKQQAAGFSIEDEIATSLGDTHIAFDANTARLAIVSTAVMKQTLAMLEVAGLSPDIICTDYEALNGDVVLKYDGRIIQHHGTGLGSAIEEGLGEFVLDDNHNMPTNISSETLMSLIVEGMASEPQPLNLRQGVFAKQMRLSGSRTRRILAMGAACLLVFVGTSLGQGHSYAKKTKLAQAEMTSIFAEVFPDTKMPKNPTIPILRAQANAKAQSGDVFIHLSKVLALSLQELQGVEIVSISYDQNREQLSLSVRYNSFDDVERLKNAIAQKGGVFIENGTRQEGPHLAGEAVLSGGA